MKKECTTPNALSGILRPLRTLIVDDSTIFLSCLHRLLDRQALIQVVDTAASGSEALHKAEALAPDLVLMDLHMPGMGALQATELLHRRLPNMRIIIMTLEETVAAKAAARTHGAHGFVGKTQITKSLMAEIQRVFLWNDPADESGST